MTEAPSFREIGVSRDGHVATVEMHRPPHNFFDSALVAEIGEAFEWLDANPECRAIVFAAEGRSFCAGADFSKRMDTGTVPKAAAAPRAAISTKRRSGCFAPKSRSSPRSRAPQSAAGSAWRSSPISV